MNANIYEGTDDIKPGVKLLPEIWKKVMRENPHETTDPKGLRHEVGNVSVPQSGKRNGPQAYPDCMQTGMHARGALIPPERQRPGLERPQDSVMGSRKTVRTVRDEGESGAKVRTPDASARGVCQSHPKLSLWVLIRRHGKSKSEPLLAFCRVRFIVKHLTVYTYHIPSG